MNRKGTKGLMMALILCLIGFGVLSMFIGPAKIPVTRIFDSSFFEIFKLRFFRLILAVSAGAGLSLSGVMLQALLRNPLAEPYILGVSSGAGLGAVIGILFFSASAYIGIMAFIGGAVTIFIVCKLAKIDTRISPENMIIAGILVNALFSSILMFFVSNTSNAKMHSVIWWLLGNLQVYKLSQVIIVSMAGLAGFLIAFIFSRELDAISLGEEEAVHLGIDMEKLKIIFLLISSLVTSIVVSVCGIIGFVGLMMPHLARRLVGPGHRMLLVSSVLMGGAFLLLCDMFSRAIMAPKEVPIGVITAFLGAPFFIYVLKKSRKVYFR
jgi:iron complex transport system permease protein